MTDSPAKSLTIAELSARSGAAPSALRYYEEIGLIQAERTSGNQRRYPRYMLRRIAFIRAGRQLGLSLREQGRPGHPAGQQGAHPGPVAAGGADLAAPHR
jgi:MerR family transcriptional regulator, redox-sensitive transcriptional activator SoxR